MKFLSVIAVVVIVIGLTNCQRGGRDRQRDNIEREEISDEGSDGRDGTGGGHTNCESEGRGRQRDNNGNDEGIGNGQGFGRENGGGRGRGGRNRNHRRNDFSLNGVSKQFERVSNGILEYLNNAINRNTSNTELFKDIQSDVIQLRDSVRQKLGSAINATTTTTTTIASV